MTRSARKFIDCKEAKGGEGEGSEVKWSGVL